MHGSTPHCWLSLLYRLAPRGSTSRPLLPANYPLLIQLNSRPAFDPFSISEFVPSFRGGTVNRNRAIEHIVPRRREFAAAAAGDGGPRHRRQITSYCSRWQPIPAELWLLTLLHSLLQAVLLPLLFRRNVAVRRRPLLLPLPAVVIEFGDTNVIVVGVVEEIRR